MHFDGLAQVFFLGGGNHHNPITMLRSQPRPSSALNDRVTLLRKSVRLMTEAGLFTACLHLVSGPIWYR